MRSFIWLSQTTKNSLSRTFTMMPCKIHCWVSIFPTRSSYQGSFQSENSFLAYFRHSRTSTCLMWSRMQMKKDLNLKMIKTKRKGYWSQKIGSKSSQHIHTTQVSVFSSNMYRNRALVFSWWGRRPSFIRHKVREKVSLYRKDWIKKKLKKVNFLDPNLRHKRKGRDKTARQHQLNHRQSRVRCRCDDLTNYH